MPQPTTPMGATRHGSIPSGRGRVQPWMNRALSGIFSVSPMTWMAITALGRDTAVLKPRYTVNSRDAGSENASANMAWCTCRPAARSLPAPNSCPATGLMASTMPMKPIKTVMYTASCPISTGQAMGRIREKLSRSDAK